MTNPTNPWSGDPAQPETQVAWPAPQSPFPPQAPAPGPSYLPGPNTYQHPQATTTYGLAPNDPVATISHIQALARSGWPPEAIAADLAYRRIPTLAGRLPFIGDAWRPYMVKRIVAGEAPHSSATLIAGLGAWLVNPLLLVSVASIALFVQTRREIRASRGRLSGGGRAATGLIFGLLAGLLVAAALVFTIYLQTKISQGGIP